MDQDHLRPTSLIATVLIVALLGFVPCGRAQSIEPAGFESFDNFVEGQLSRWNVPGAVIAVIRDGEILFVRGYGLRDVERGLPMTARTAMPIGSITKPMVAISIAKLVREKRLAWDRPVREWTPDFRLANDMVAAQVTLRDMLTHRTSFSGSDWGWYGAPQTREQLFAKLRHFELQGGLRERFQYSDIMYTAAAHIASKVANAPWEEMARRDILEPLGMKGVGFTLSQLVLEPDFALPYGYDAEGKLSRFQPVEAQWVNPGGGFVYASGEDMASFVAMLAAGGTFRGAKVIDAADLALLTTPQVLTPFTYPHAEMGRLHYGMGFFVGPYRDRTLVQHGGTNNGWQTRIAYFPALRSGFYVGYNGIYGQLKTVLSNEVLDRILGARTTDWSGRIWAEREKSRAAAAATREQRSRGKKSDAPPSRSLAAFAGSYFHPAYGELTVHAHSGDGLQMTFHGYAPRLQHRHFDVFEVPPTQRSGPFDPLADALLQFVSGFDGEVHAVRANLEQGSPPIEFVRRAQ